MHVVEESQIGGTVDIAVGEVLTIRLKENATTGYRWTVEQADGLQVEDSQQPGAAPGAAGTHEFRVRAARPGTYELRLKHWRDWQGEAGVIARQRISLRAQ
nr:protease inhibitor I42 family protein [uncultured Massilia sp.]